MKLSRVSTLIFASAALSTAALAQNIVVDGSFETPGVPTGSYLIVNGGNSYGSWNVFGSRVLAIETSYSEPSQGVVPFAAQDGLVSIDLTGAGNEGYAGVEQSLSTVIGQQYTVSFYVGRADGTSSNYTTPSSISLLLDNVNVGTYTNSNITTGTTNWQMFSTTFTATGTSTLLGFANATSDNNFAGIDNVSVVPVPEPASMAVLGLGLAALRRRRAKK